MFNQRMARRALILIALTGLIGGLAVKFLGRPELAQWLWTAGAIPVVASLAVSIVRDLRAGRMGVDAVALLAMAAALALGEALAAIVVAIMYAGGAVLEDYAVGRAERDLKSLIDRAPRVAHRKSGGAVEDVPVDAVAVGDALVVRAGEVVPVDGQIASPAATLDESAVTGEPIPVTRLAGEAARSGAVNAGETFEMRASATAGDSTYAGIVKMVSSGQTAKAPFIRMADRFALILLPVTLVVAGAAWFFSGDPIRGLAVLVAATPCPLILAAPVAFIAGAAQAARCGILIKGGGPLEALARAYTVMFDKTGTLTVGGARLVAIEAAPGEEPDDLLRFAGSLEQASHHVVAAAIVSAAVAKGLKLQIPRDVRETMGSGLEGVVEGRAIRVGSHQLVCGGARMEAWAARALRRASWRSALSVFVSIDGRGAGALLLADELRPEAPRAIRALRAARVARIVMVTGDRADSAETIGAALDLDAVLADRVPADKVEAVELEQRLHPTVMVGDGINDAPALAAADVGIAMGARGASASSEAADVVILVDQIDRVSDAVVIARRTRAIALQSIVTGLALSGLAMGAAAFGWLSPVAGALTQEAIDVAVILNALRALGPGGTKGRRATMAETDALGLRQDHDRLNKSLDRLRQIADALDDADAKAAVAYLAEANRIVADEVVEHERADESSVYPQLSSLLPDSSGLFAMSRAHREILHMGRLLGRLSDGLGPGDADRYLIRDGQRIIESIESLVRIHNAQEQDIYENAGAESVAKKRWLGAAEPKSAKSRSATRTGWAARAAAAALALVILGGGWFVWSVRRDAPAHKPPPGPQHRTATAIGVIQPIDAVAIHSQASGEIQSIGCESGADIKVGQLCAKIDPRPFKASIDRATIALAAAETRRVTTSSALAAAKGAFEQSEKKAKRKAISRHSLEVKRKAYEQALTQANEAEASMAQRQDELRAAEISLARTDIVSPVDGTVFARNLEAGQRVSADSGTALFLIATDLAFIEVRSRLTGNDLAETKQGDKAVFTVEAFPDRSYSGEVMRIGEIVRESQTPGSGEVNAGDNLSIRAPNPDRSLKPGMVATIKINLEGKAVGE